jgi:PGF-CTERM protein
MSDSPGEPTVTPGQPGFGVVVALLSLLGTVLLAMRRRG